MGGSLGGSRESPDVKTYFGSQAYYKGELLKDSRYQYSEDSETIIVTLESGDKVTMWSYAIDVRDSEDPERELPERGFNEEEDYVLFHYTDAQAMDGCGTFLVFASNRALQSEALQVKGEEMSPKRARRPAAAVPPPRAPRMRRPAAPVVAVEPAKKLRHLNLVEIPTKKPLRISRALYYGREVEVVGKVVDVKLEHGQIYGFMRVTGTRDEELLRCLSGQPDRILKVHFCEDACSGALTSELLVHGKEYLEVEEADEDWYTNLLTAEAPLDENARLRMAAVMGTAPERGEGEEPPREAKESSKKEKKRKAKKEEKEREGGKKKEAVEVGGENLEVGQRPLGDVFAGTGLDPDVKRRERMHKKARRLVSSSSKKKKKKKKGSSEDSNSQSSSTSSSSSSMSDGGELFGSEKKLASIWRRYPGTLAAKAVSEAKRTLVTQAGTMWSEDKHSLPPVMTQYGRAAFLEKMSPGMAQEGLTICQCLDLLLLGKIGSCADVLSQRLKSLESSAKGAHYTVGRQMELVRMDHSGISADQESLDAAKRAREEEKLKSLTMRAPGAGKSYESNYGSKGKKGKDTKGTTKGRQNDGGKGKGGDEKREDTRGGWQKKEK
eukprot:Skav210119  [mRNA]  locus=scaffold2194:148664:154054:+ [translate_table: standard]